MLEDSRLGRLPLEQIILRPAIDTNWYSWLAPYTHNSCNTSSLWGVEKRSRKEKNTRTAYSPSIKLRIPFDDDQKFFGIAVNLFFESICYLFLTVFKLCVPVTESSHSQPAVCTGRTPNRASLRKCISGNVAIWRNRDFNHLQTWIQKNNLRCRGPGLEPILWSACPERVCIAGSANPSVTC